jgi:hypothetical protein
MPTRPAGRRPSITEGKGRRFSEKQNAWLLEYVKNEFTNIGLGISWQQVANAFCDEFMQIRTTSMPEKKYQHLLHDEKYQKKMKEPSR